MSGRWELDSFSLGADSSHYHTKIWEIHEKCNVTHWDLASLLNELFCTDKQGFEACNHN